MTQVGYACARVSDYGEPRAVPTLAFPVTLERCFADGPIEVLMTRLDELPEADAAACLSDGERQRAARYRFAPHRRRFVVARARLRELLGARLGVPPEAVELAYGRHGKPALAPRFARAGWHFNVSHSDELAVYALSRGPEVGVDVEAVRPFPAMDRAAEQCFSPRELDAYRALGARERPLGFFRGWTRKEALLKALGLGLAAPPRPLDVSLSHGESPAFAPLPGFIAALAILKG